MMGSDDEQRAPAEDINRWLAAGQVRADIDRILSLVTPAFESR
jgi:hypothetical protein